jgi:hypothetical protein
MAGPAAETEVWEYTDMSKQAYNWREETVTAGK